MKIIFDEICVAVNRRYGLYDRKSREYVQIAEWIRDSFDNLYFKGGSKLY